MIDPISVTPLPMIPYPLFGDRKFHAWHIVFKGMKTDSIIQDHDRRYKGILVKGWG